MDLYIIETPLQLLNAIEARYQFGDCDCELIILNWPCWPKTAFARLLNEIKWNRIIWLPIKADRPNIDYPMVGRGISRQINEYVWTLIQYIRRTILNKHLDSVKLVNRLVVGNLLNLPHLCHVISRIKYLELIAVDDGTYTLEVADIRQKLDKNSQRSLSLKNERKFSRLKRLVRERWIEWNNEQPEAVTFFTTFDCKFGPRDQVIFNNYKWLRERAIRGSKNGRIYFLGQPLIEDGWVREETYLGYLKKAVEFLGIREVCYLPHKRESVRTVSLVKSEVNIDILCFEDPIELVLLIDGQLPNVLASFHCSALENCLNIFADLITIKSFYLPADALLCGHSFIESLYSHYDHIETQYFNVVYEY